MRTLAWLATGALALGSGTPAIAPAAAAPAPLVVRGGFATVAPEAWRQADPGDSLYRAARTALNRGRYQQAADAFQRLLERYPRFGYAADALYWEAYARYRLNDSSNLRRARELLAVQKARYPRAATRGDGDALQVRIDGELARRGDATSAVAVTTLAEKAATLAEVQARLAEVNTGVRSRVSDAAVARVRADLEAAEGGADRCDNDDDTRSMALNALMQMNPDEALPILKKVLARRDPGSECLRRRAVFIVARTRTPETADLLLSAVRNDPDQGVREQAVFWLSRVDSPRAVAALDSILRNSKDPDIQQKALFALSRQDSPAALATLRSYATRNDISDETRSQAIMFLSRRSDAGNLDFLKSIYPKASPDLRSTILMTVARSRDPGAAQWLMDIARDPSESAEVRGQAIFFATQSGLANSSTVSALYGTATDREMKEKLLFALSRSRDSAAVTKMIDIARHDTDPELRKQAIFWLGRSGDPRAQRALEEVLEQ